MNIATHQFVVAEMTLAEVIERLKTLPDLTPRRLRDLISAINTTARLFNRHPAEIVADMDELRQRFEAIHPVQAGISAKRLANLKSDLKAAILKTRLVIRLRQRRSATAPAPETPNLPVLWQAFRASLETPWQRYALSRLIRFCLSTHVPPIEMSDDVIAAFHSHLPNSQLAKDPDKIVQITRQTWNGVVSRTGAKLPLVSKPPSRRFITRPLTDYPQSFQDDLEAWLMRLSTASMYDEDAPPKPLRSTSLRNIRANIRQFAHALVGTGRSPDSLRSLADLVEISAYKKGLQHFVDRNGGTPPSGLANMAAHLVALARYHLKVDPRELDRLRTIKGRCAVATDGLTARNRDRLRQFEDEENLDRLVTLPDQLLRRARAKKQPSSRDALDVMYAVAIDILLACPMRVGNLAALDIDRHLRWYGQGRNQRLAIVIPGSEVKNDQPIELDLPKERLGLIKAYLADWRPRLATVRGNTLFPDGSGRSRLPGHFSDGISRVIYRETGIRMNAHLFRHMAGKLFLDQHPGEYETVRRLLGHRKIETTTGFYAPLENRRAIQRYDEAVLSNRRVRR